MNKTQAQRIIRDLSPLYLQSFPVSGDTVSGLKEAHTVPHPTRQKELSETPTNLSGGVESRHAHESGNMTATYAEEETSLPATGIARDSLGSGPFNAERGSSAPPAQTFPCSECSEETPVSELTTDGHGFKLCPKCYVPDEDEEGRADGQWCFSTDAGCWIYE